MMENSPDIHRAIEKLEATLHSHAEEHGTAADEPASESAPEPIRLTEEMLISPPERDEKFRQMIIASVEQSVRERLPQLIEEAVEQALAEYPSESAP